MPKNKLKKKIENAIKIHMYNKGITHFEFWKEKDLKNNLMKKFPVSLKTITKAYIKLGFEFTLSDEREKFEAQLGLYSELIRKHKMQNFGVVKVNTDFKCEVYFVLELSFFSGKSFDDILKLCTELKIDVSTNLKEGNTYNKKIIDELV